MIINIRNNCGSRICVEIENTWNGIVKPNDIVSISCNRMNNFTFWVSVYDASIIEGSIYNLNLLSQYTFKNVKDDAEFVITREKLRVSLYVVYERLFVETTKAIKDTEITIVKEGERVKKRYKRDRFIELLCGPLTHFPALSIILFIGGILLAWFMDWCFVFVYYPFAYFGLFGLHWLVDFFWRCVSQKAFKIDDISEFYQFFDPMYISYYYSQSNREPFMGKVDRN